MYYHYSADEFHDRNGDRFSALGGGGSIEAAAWVAGSVWVSDYKVLGGNYSFAVFPGVNNNAPDFIAGIGLFAPTGEYEAGGSVQQG